MDHAGWLSERTSELPRGERRLMFALVGLSLVALTVGVLLALVLGLDRGGFLDLDGLLGYEILTGHAATAFYNWFYLVQAGLLLLLMRVSDERIDRVHWSKLAWTGVGFLTGGLVLNLVAPLMGAAGTYKVAVPLSANYGGMDVLVLGYLLIFVGLACLAGAALRTAFEVKRRDGGTWTFLTFTTSLWWILVVVASFASIAAYLPVFEWLTGLGPIPGNFGMAWGVQFHNLHYLPFLSTHILWYVIASTTTGVSSIFSKGFSKAVFSIYLLVIPPTSLYHMFMTPGVSGGLKTMGSVLALLISVPVLTAFFLIITSMEASSRERGVESFREWLGELPWKHPTFAAAGIGVLNAALGGISANVLIQHDFADVIISTFFVPAYFHFFTVGTVTLTFLGVLAVVVPALADGKLWGRDLLLRAPWVVTAGLVLFSVPGGIAGLLGMPRQTLDATYGGFAPEAWSVLSAVMGVGALLMVTGVLVFVYALVRSAIGGEESLVSLQRLTLSPAEPGSQRAVGPMIAVGILVTGWFALTIVIRLVQLGVGGGH